MKTGLALAFGGAFGGAFAASALCLEDRLAPGADLALADAATAAATAASRFTGWEGVGGSGREWE